MASHRSLRRWALNQKSAQSPAQSMKELHELGRKKPGGLTFGSPGLGSQQLAKTLNLRPQ
jgi:hypothetical protein